MTNATSEAITLVNLLKQFQVAHPKTVLLYCYNQATVHTVSNPVFHELTKHIELDYYVVN